MTLKIIQAKPEVNSVSGEIYARPPMPSTIAGATNTYLSTSAAGVDRSHIASFWNSYFGENSAENTGIKHTGAWGTVAAGSPVTKTIADVSGDEPGLLTHIVGPELNGGINANTRTTFKVTTDYGVFIYDIKNTQVGRAILGATYNSAPVTGVSNTYAGMDLGYRLLSGAVTLKTKMEAAGLGIGIPHQGNYKVEITVTDGIVNPSLYYYYSGVSGVRGTHNYREPI